MKTTVVICVHDRYENIKHWLQCWQKCGTENAELVIIHNFSTPDEKYKKICDEYGAKYVWRKGVGFDIGAFQDVCKGRLKNFPEWDRLLWCTDDTFPMVTDFIKQFERKMFPGIGVVAMEVSPYVRTHIRTTGFMIDKEIAQKLKFHRDPILTKQDCWLFEHRDIKGHFYEQIKKLGLGSVMPTPAETSPLWDSGYHRALDRRQEHENLFGVLPGGTSTLVKDEVTFLCPIYNSFPAIIASLIMQTNPHWKLKLIHNGPELETPIESFIHSINDDRIQYLQTAEHTGNWGHAIRAEYLKKTESKYIVITNPDNYYAPIFIDVCFKFFKQDSKTVAVYVSKMIHSYIQWGVINCQVKRGYIDCGGVMLKTKEAAAVGWNNVTDHSADWFFFEDIVKKYGLARFKPIPGGVLFVHN